MMMLSKMGDGTLQGLLYTFRVWVTIPHGDEGFSAAYFKFLLLLAEKFQVGIMQIVNKGRI